MTAGFFFTKIGRLIVTLWVVITLTFFALNASGDPIEMIMGSETDPVLIEHYRAKYGLDRPLVERYFQYFVNVAQRDFGISLLERRPAIDVVLERIPATIRLGLAALVIAFVVGLPLGILAALYRGTLIDRFTMSFAVLGFSIPNFLLAIVMILLFSMTLRLLPTAGAETWQHIIMPAAALGMKYAGEISRFSRSAMLEVLSRPYMRTAVAKGAGPWRRSFWHALPNAAAPILTVMGFRLGEVVSGAIVVEVVFAWPGIGRLLAGSVALRDIAVVQAILIITASAMVVANLLADITYRLADPRLRRPAVSRGTK